jgi:hypothetical protein
MAGYEQQVRIELHQWQRKMKRRPSIWNKTSKFFQRKVNNIIPDRVHQLFTTTIKQMTRAVLTGAEYTTSSPLQKVGLEERERRVLGRIEFYRNTAAIEGAVTGAGGILMGLADFPIWLTLKMKMLFEIAALYGFDAGEYKERIYLLHIFQLSFSSQEHRNQVYLQLAHWEQYSQTLPEDINQFDWLHFQQEYRDYIDLAKLLQLVPGIGAVVGAYVNHKLTDQLGHTAMNAYRMRWMKAGY